MFYIGTNNDITITRGDSAIFSCFINKGSNLCPDRKILIEDEKLYFIVTRLNDSPDNYVFRKEYNANSPKNEQGDTLITLDYDDTKNMCLGEYQYCIKYYEPSTNSIQTAVPMRQFVVVE